MYIRRSTRRRKDGSEVCYLQLCHNAWDAERGRSVTRVLHNLGREDQLDPAAVERLIASLRRLLSPERQLADTASAEALSWRSSARYGGAWTLDGLWRQLGLDTTLRTLLKDRRVDEAHVERVLFALVANRALEPMSKHAAATRWVGRQAAVPGLDQVTDDACYRAMDVLLEVEAALAEQVYANVASLLNLETDLILFDTTSTYFEVEEADPPDPGAEPRADGKVPAGFRSHGNSKDHRSDLPQAVVGLAVTREGIPIRAWTWPGRTGDSELIRQAKDDLRGWGLSRVVWVGDRGFTSEDNRRYLQRAGGHYFLGEKLRANSADAKTALARQGRYRQVAGNLRVKEVSVEEAADRFVVCHNPEQAARDAAIRDRLVAQLGEAIAGSDELTPTRRAELRGELRTKPGLHRYLRVTAGGLLRVDKSKVNAEAKLDGKYLLRTSDPSLTPEDVALGYKQLAEVEAGWREMKHTLDLRPVYHCLADRIRAHVILCWLALLLTRIAETRTGETWRNLRDELEQMHLGTFASPTATVTRRTETTAAQQRILNTLGLAQPPAISDILADLCPEELVARLGEMLPRPAVTGIIINPAHQPRQVSDFDRRAAAGTVEHLASTHLELAVQLLPNLAISLGVPAEDSYDPGTIGAVERALARTFVAAPVRIAGLLEDAGRHASEETRNGLVGSVRHALDMVDTEYVHRRAHDPVTTPEEAAAVTDAAFSFLLARLDESWGHQVTFSAAEAIEQMGRGHRDVLAGHLDATLGAFVTLTRHRLTEQESVLTSTAAPDPLAGMEAWSRKTSLYQSARRLLNAVESASSTDPLAVCETITALITSERDSDLGAEVVYPLLATLGEVGRRHGHQPGVLQAILPALHTYLVDADPGPRAAALEAWTTIGGTHDLPSTVADLLPALVSDAYVVMIDAVLTAACRLPWPDRESRIRLAFHAVRVMEGINVSEHLDTFLASLSALRHHVPEPAALAELEKKALARVPKLEWHQAAKVTDQPWQPDARVAPELAVLWLALAPRHTSGLRQRDEAEEALNGLLDCGAGLLGLPAADIIEIGAAHSPESHYGSMEYAEVLARAERRTDVVALLEGALTRIPDEPARTSQRALVALAAAVGRLHVTLEPDVPDGAKVRDAVDGVGAAISICLGHSGDDLRWLRPFASAAAVRASVVCTLLDVPTPAEVTAGLADTPASQAAAGSVEPTDPAEQFKARAQRLRDLSAVLLAVAAVVRQRDVADGRAVLVPPLGGPHVHAHKHTTPLLPLQAYGTEACAHTFERVAARTALLGPLTSTFTNAPVRVPLRTAELGVTSRQPGLDRTQRSWQGRLVRSRAGCRRRSARLVRKSARVGVVRLATVADRDHADGVRVAHLVDDPVGTHPVGPQAG